MRSTCYCVLLPNKDSETKASLEHKHRIGKLFPAARVLATRVQVDYRYAATLSLRVGIPCKSVMNHGVPLCQSKSRENASNSRPETQQRSTILLITPPGDIGCATQNLSCWMDLTRLRMFDHARGRPTLTGLLSDAVGFPLAEKW